MKTVKKLNNIIKEHQAERICILGTTCCGKSTLKEQIPEAVDCDEVLWPKLSKDEEAYICQKPWTKEIGSFTARLVHERVHIEPGHPLFSLILLECDVAVYLEISDELLRKHCEMRGAEFDDAKNVKNAIEDTWKRCVIGNQGIKRYVVEVEE